jgi:hypothetical protein
MAGRDREEGAAKRKRREGEKEGEGGKEGEQERSILLNLPILDLYPKTSVIWSLYSLRLLN